MRRASPAALHDRLSTLLTQRREAEAEFDRLVREERFLATQRKEAEEQVRYYEGLLSVMRREWGKPRHLTDLVRRLG
ncbi:MAG: hypothetical protein L3K15_03335 [Thermoplasmata archaeon]|nr:hypothetical protein [Thermoplasmata archaeon]